jgi:hypothetical protein
MVTPMDEWCGGGVSQPAARGAYGALANLLAHVPLDQTAK